jgi:hypothetical protein
VIELRAERMLVLRCGKSEIRMDGESIDIRSLSVVINGEDAGIHVGGGKIFMKARDLVQGLARQVLMAGEGGGTVAVTSEVALDGDRILCNSPADACDPISAEHAEPTIIELVDQNNQPIARHPYRILLAGGGERAGVLGEDGRAEIDLEQGGRIVFPGLGPLERV